MAQESVLSTGEYGGHPTFQAADFASCHHENPTMKGAEAAGFEAVVDRLVAKAQLTKLRSSDYAVLLSRQRPGAAGLSVTLPCHGTEK
jgi:hypothetical protein